MQEKLQKQSKVLARQNADIKFAKQTEASLRNCLSEKNCQLENITAQSQQLIQQLNEIETSLKKQQSEHQEKLTRQMNECQRLEKAYNELCGEADRLRNFAESGKQKNVELKAVEQDLRKKLLRHEEESLSQIQQVSFSFLNFLC